MPLSPYFLKWSVTVGSVQCIPDWLKKLWCNAIGSEQTFMVVGYCAGTLANFSQLLQCRVDMKEDDIGSHSSFDH